MKEVPTDCNKIENERLNKSSGLEETQDTKDFNDTAIANALFNKIEEKLSNIIKRIVLFLLKTVAVVFLLLLLLFLQAVLYKDIENFLKTFSVSILLAKGLFLFCSKKIENKWKLGIKAFPVIKKAISVILGVAVVSTALWQLPIVKAKVIDVALSVVNHVEEKINENSDETNEEENETTYLEQSEYNANAEFIINNYCITQESYSEVFEKVYFYVNQNADAESILKYFGDICGVKKPVKEDIEFSKIQTQEDDFLTKQEKGVDYKEKNGVNEEWYKMLPHENELRKVIHSQKEYAGSYPNYIIFLRLSNNYQRLGKEYLNQKASNLTIKYFYYMSLIYDYECIKYAENSTQFNSALSRVYYRLQDIISFCEITGPEREMAQFIMEGLDSYEYLSP